MLATMLPTGETTSASLTTTPFQHMVCDPRGYGATGNGITLDSTAINNAIDYCSAHAGGTVSLTPGVYRSGTIVLKDNVDLDIEAGAVISASANLSDYSHLAHASEGRDTALIVTQNTHNVAITGQGTINGNGRAFINPNGPQWQPSFDISLTRQGQTWANRMAQSREGPLNMLPRPGVLLLALHADGIQLRDFHVVDSPNWTIKIGCSRHIYVTGIDVRNNLLIPNNDALDISTSQDATVEDSYLQAGDDALVIGGPCLDGWCQDQARHIRVSNVTLVSRSAAIRVGPSAQGVSDVTFNNITIDDSNRGILIHTRSSETVDNIVFNHVRIKTRLIDGPWWGAGEPIAISVARWDYVSWQPSTSLGFVRNIRFNDVVVDSQSPVIIHSMEPGHIEEVAFQKVALKVSTGPLTTILGGNLDLQPTSPINFGVRKEDLPAVLVHNADRLSFSGLTVTWAGSFPPYYTNAIAADGFAGLTIDDFQGASASGTLPAIQLANGTHARITKAQATQGKLLVTNNVNDINYR
jgi:polygalacturonase